MVTPLFLMLLIGILCYGGYLSMAHSVQQLANDSARAAVAGLDTTERAQIAQQSVSASMSHYPLLDAARIKVNVADQDRELSTQVSYDASASLVYAFGALIPLPPPLIKRDAAVRLGGY